MSLSRVRKSGLLGSAWLPRKTCLAHLVFMLAALTASANAATIDIHPMGLGAPDLIVVDGELVLEDAGRFQRVAARTSKAVVAFSGPGGNAVAAVVIGETIRLRNFASVVLEGDLCVSGCAIAWLGGVRRFRGRRARIGFHSARDLHSGNVSGIGNAIVGAYMHRIGLSTQAVRYLTAAAPDKMAWLTLADAKTHGIDVEYLVPSTAPFSPSRNTAKKNAGKDLTPLEKEAVAFVKDHAAAESQPSSIALAAVQPHYADTVFYYGKYLDQPSVLKEYQTFVEKWPERHYSVRPDSIEPQCIPDIGLCDVTAIIDWVFAGQPGGKKSVGQSIWTLSLVRHRGSLAITSVKRVSMRKRRPG
jgi:hypothetical protein